MTVLALQCRAPEKLDWPAMNLIEAFTTFTKLEFYSCSQFAVSDHHEARINSAWMHPIANVIVVVSHPVCVLCMLLQSHAWAFAAIHINQDLSVDGRHGRCSRWQTHPHIFNSNNWRRCFLFCHHPAVVETKNCVVSGPRCRHPSHSAPPQKSGLSFCAFCSTNASELLKFQSLVGLFLVPLWRNWGGNCSFLVYNFWKNSLLFTAWFFSWHT